MNQAELNTHQTIQYYLPRVAVALEEISKTLKESLEQIKKNSDKK